MLKIYLITVSRYLSYSFSNQGLRRIETMEPIFITKSNFGLKDATIGESNTKSQDAGRFFGHTVKRLPPRKKKQLVIFLQSV